MQVGLARPPPESAGQTRDLRCAREQRVQDFATLTGTHRRVGGVALVLALSWGCTDGEARGSARAGNGGSSGSISLGSGASPGTGAVGVGGAGIGDAGGASGAATVPGGAAGTPPSLGDGRCSPSLGPHTWAVALAERILVEWPSPRQIMNEGGLFQYNSGIVLRGLVEVHARTCDPRIVDYVRAYVDESVDGAGHLTLPQGHDFDALYPAALLPFLHATTGDERYRIAAREVIERYATIPVNGDGAYWHKARYPNELWCDTLFVGLTPLAVYRRQFDDCGELCVEAPVNHALLLAEHAERVPGLLRHAWDADRDAAWADAVSGAAPVVWGRGMGWYTMALVETLETLPPTHARRGELVALLERIATALSAAQDSTGLFFQVVDQPTVPGNFLETSSTGMFAFALHRAVERGLLPEAFRGVAEFAFDGLLAEARLAIVNGLPRVTGAVEGMGVQPSVEQYTNKSLLADSSHGLCGVLLAAAELGRQIP